VVGGEEGHRAGLAVAGDARVDDPRAGGGDRRVVDAEMLGDAGAEVLEQDLGPAGQAEEEPARTGILEVHGHALLAPVEDVEVDALAVAEGPDVAGGVPGSGGPPLVVPRPPAGGAGNA